MEISLRGLINLTATTCNLNIADDDKDNYKTKYQ